MKNNLLSILLLLPLIGCAIQPRYASIKEVPTISLCASSILRPDYKYNEVQTEIATRNVDCNQYNEQIKIRLQAKQMQMQMDNQYQQQLNNSLEKIKESFNSQPHPYVINPPIVQLPAERRSFNCITNKSYNGQTTFTNCN